MTETAGFYNTAGFNDDTRVFTSILRGMMSPVDLTVPIWLGWWRRVASAKRMHTS